MLRSSARGGRRGSFAHEGSNRKERGSPRVELDGMVKKARACSCLPFSFSFVSPQDKTNKQSTLTREAAWLYLHLPRLPGGRGCLPRRVRAAQRMRSKKKMQPGAVCELHPDTQRAFVR